MDEVRVRVTPDPHTCLTEPGSDCPGCWDEADAEFERRQDR